jgi:hypothetical protein
MMRMDKKQARLWSKRMHTSLKCYKENLINLYALERKIVAFNEANSTVSNSEKENDNKTRNNNEEADLVELAESLMAEVNPATCETVTTVQTETKSLLDERYTALLTKLKSIFFNLN